MVMMVVSNPGLITAFAFAGVTERVYDSASSALLSSLIPGEVHCPVGGVIDVKVRSTDGRA